MAHHPQRLVCTCHSSYCHHSHDSQTVAPPSCATPAHSLLAFCVASAAAVTSAVRLAELSTGLESMMARRM